MRALLVGIDAYDFGRLGGCVADAVALSDVLSTHSDGSPNWRTELMRGSDGEPPIKDEKKPLRGIWVYADDRTNVEGVATYAWSDKNISDFIDSL